MKNIIRTAVKSILANTDLSAYRINKIVKTETENPCSWGAGDNEDRETCIRRYYENIHVQNVFANFVDHLQLAYGFNYFNHLA